MTVTVRRATDGDIEAIARLQLELFELQAEGAPRMFAKPSSETDAVQTVEAQIEGLLADRLRALWITEEAGEVTGFVNVSVETLPASEGLPFRRSMVQGWIEQMVVGRRHQRRGHARVLSSAACSWARQQGAECVGLQVWEFNTGARRLYEELGFRSIAQRMYLWEL